MPGYSEILGRRFILSRNPGIMKSVPNDIPYCKYLQKNSDSQNCINVGETEFINKLKEK